MNKHLSTSAAALALVSAIGLAYAQGEPQPANPDTTTEAQPATTSPMADDPAAIPATPGIRQRRRHDCHRAQHHDDRGRRQSEHHARA